MTTYFKNITTIEELKKEYRRLIKLNHPDNGGDTATMAAINNEYEYTFNRLKNGKNTAETADMFKDVINAIINLNGITIEICGSWVWVSGDTFACKTILKEVGFRWASKKKMWYWHSPDEHCQSRKGGKEMSEIRFKYGSETVKTKPQFINAF